MLSHDSYVRNKLGVIDQLLGKSKISHELKHSFVSMLINPKHELVKKREIGKSVMERDLDTRV